MEVKLGEKVLKYVMATTLRTTFVDIVMDVVIYLYDHHILILKAIRGIFYKSLTILKNNS